MKEEIAKEFKTILISSLPWWISDSDVIKKLAEAGLDSQLISHKILFEEHKQNGKSKGRCLVPFKTESIIDQAIKYLNEQYQSNSIDILVHCMMETLLKDRVKPNFCLKMS
jgi:RNA recognition motif-containing protein